MSANPHSNHPLYAFLQSDTARHHVPSESPPPPTDERTESGMIGADRALNKHLVTLLTTVQSHSAQLDQMVKHINSLVRRVESVESIFSEGQEQVHQSVTEFKADTEKIALQTGDRINLTLQPTLNVFIDSLSSIEHSQKMDTLQKGFDTLNSSLAPIALMAPLLKAFLESQLAIIEISRIVGKSSERSHDADDHAEVSKHTVNRRSSAISLRVANPTETRKVTFKKTLTVECCQSNQVRQTARADLKETATIFHGEQTGGSSEAEAEHEPTITQASQNHYKDKGAYGGGGETEEVMGETLDRILISHPSSKRRSMSRGRISTQQVLGLNVIQGGSCFTETTLGLHKTHSKKRGRSHTPVTREITSFDPSPFRLLSYVGSPSMNDLLLLLFKFRIFDLTRQLTMVNRIQFLTRKL
ncbi:hypothetical protein PSTT_03085 [Puccinia striiformis]|uniref:Uncharacterized protein n=1 Tax=Puccinia striiformis TaxID=27350 RepID=A0A2S4VXJ8_9BASI|nr:hypothetical protein PSTT_03085 [Puccinia striiformis]